MTLAVGSPIRIKPGLRNRPSISGREGVVLEAVNDRLRVKIGSLIALVERSEVQSR
jgi:hypothetical protein